MLRGEYRKGHVRVGDARPVWPGNVMIIYNVIVYNIIRTLELYEELVHAVIADASFPTVSHSDAKFVGIIFRARTIS